MPTEEKEKNAVPEVAGQALKEHRDIIPLSPVERIEDLNENAKEDYQIYKKYLTQAIENNRVHNIAVSGIFGVGKSSILRVFESEQEKTRWLHVSMGSFRRKPNDGVKKNKVQGENAEEGERVSVKTKERCSNQRDLEIDLLRQITAECDRNDIPKSSFELVPAQINWLKKIERGVIAFAVFALVSLIFIFSSEYVTDAVKTMMYWSIAGLTALGVGIFSYYALPKLRIKHIALKSNNAEMVADCKEAGSYLEQHCFELVYVLESLARKDNSCVVVFEDMDRLETNSCVDLFEKLREINNLVNRRLQGKKKLTFIYVINDELIGHMRTEKFFDYIMPIIPVVSQRNLCCNLCANKLQEILAKEFFNATDDNVCEMIAAIGAGLSDYRTIYTIINEYKVFCEIGAKHGNVFVDEGKLDPKLFAFVVYKNLCPQGYYQICKDGELPNDWMQDFTKLPTCIRNLYRKGFLCEECVQYIGC